MSITAILANILWLYLLVLIGRVIFDIVQMLARDWRPTGVVLLIAETIYTLTDPPLRALRRIIPPIRVGGVAFDVAFIVLFIGLQLLIAILARM